MYNEYWETDEFEDLVSRSLIGLHENNIKKNKKIPKEIRLNDDIYKRFKQTGCYFTPHDRVCHVTADEDGRDSFTQEIDVLNDGIPDKISLTMNPGKDGDGYLNAIYIEKVPFMPGNWASEIKGKYFRFMQMFFENKHISGYGTFVVIDKDGKVQSCFMRDSYIDPITKRGIYVKNRPIIENNTGNYRDYYSVWTAVSAQFYQDRRSLWNVQAQEGIAKATFGVYPEQIQSLFYARDLPQTETGRKRPILHWVNAHQRRMQSGTEVDVDKYLRGTHEFVMNGTKFKITNPLKVRS